MASRLSKTQIDRLGEELRRSASAAKPLDVGGLDAYRREFDVAAEKMAQQLGFHGLDKFTQRTKSTPSIRDKLLRQTHTRLSQVQDILGIRFVVLDWPEQEELCSVLAAIFPDHKIFDRRATPTFGYRAMHLVVQVDGNPVEIQIRTHFQHLWSELSENFADKESQELKYGGGDQRLSAFLVDLSENVHNRELQLLQLGLRLPKEQIEEEFKALLPKGIGSV